jgi:D-aminoacyl-tRNA deacylase
MFVELGSSPLQWSDFRAAEAVARATTNAIANFGFSEEKAVLGIGGTHYNQRFTKMALKNEAIFGHMIPKYAVAAVDAEILRHCMERMLETVTSAIIDWKGIKSDDKQRLLKVLGDVGLPFEKV